MWQLKHTSFQMLELTATTNTPSNFILFVKSDLDEEVLSDTLVMNSMDRKQPS